MSPAKTIALLYKNSSSIPPQIIEAMKQRTPTGFTLEICDAQTSDDRRQAILKDAEFVMVYSVPLDDYDVLGAVKLVQLLSAGSDLLDVGKFRQLDIPVANNGSVNSWTVAEHTVLLMLGLLRKLPLHHNSMQHGIWLGHQHALSMRELRGKQVGIIGFGHIGQSVAQIVAGFQGNVCYYSRSQAPLDVEQQHNARWMPLNELLQTSDIITIHTPLLESTKSLLSYDEFQQMKPSSLLINTARGAIVDEAALVHALDNHLIAGAALDTFITEPLAKDNPFIGRENVIVTPHVVGTSIDNWERRIQFCFSNILRSLHGEPLHSVINR
ncbi:NAD(P)-dependent oxidoreductase [Vibrio fluvialis]|uniref:NAD(P)-dependent oxidoreductase n=1 Tax=Vibrio fluvialis TaxID=676 RepID=UPI001F2401C7|nr:NAD(P)-dependent oxidoreductase [Vibrio fluvialis]MCE7644413.1 hypothetical protein [Vibrio fluvialis]